MSLENLYFFGGSIFGCLAVINIYFCCDLIQFLYHDDDNQADDDDRNHDDDVDQ